MFNLVFDVRHGIILIYFHFIISIFQCL